jgi:hypothetical protein
LLLSSRVRKYSNSIRVKLVLLGAESVNWVGGGSKSLTVRRGEQATPPSFLEKVESGWRTRGL